MNTRGRASRDQPAPNTGRLTRSRALLPCPNTTSAEIHRDPGPSRMAGIAGGSSNLQDSVAISASAEELPSGSVPVASVAEALPPPVGRSPFAPPPLGASSDGTIPPPSEVPRRESDPAHMESLRQIVRDEIRAMVATEPLNIPAIRQAVAAEVETAVSLLRGSLVDGDLADRLVTPRLVDQVYSRIVPAINRLAFQRIEEAIEKAIERKFPGTAGPAPNSPATQSVNLKQVPPAASSVPVRRGDGHNSMASMLSEFGPAFPTLQEIVPLNDSFARVLSYRTYRLRNMDQSYNGETAGEISKLARRVRHGMPSGKFNGEDEIAVLCFLKSFKNACNDTDISEGAAFYLLRYFLEGTALSMFESYQNTTYEDARPGVDCITNYPEAVQWMLLTFAQESYLSKAYNEVCRMQQAPNEHEASFGRRLRVEAMRCGDAFREKKLVSIYVDGLLSYVQPVIRQLAEENPRISLQSLIQKAKALGESSRARSPLVNTTTTKGLPRSPRRTSLIVTPTESVASSPAGQVLALGYRPYAPTTPSLGSSVTERPYTPVAHQTTIYPTARRGSPSPIIETPQSSCNGSRSRSASPGKRDLRCHNCQRTGHYAWQCPEISDEMRERLRKAYDDYIRLRDNYYGMLSGDYRALSVGDNHVACESVLSNERVSTAALVEQDPSESSDSLNSEGGK